VSGLCQSSVGVVEVCRAGRDGRGTWLTISFGVFCSKFNAGPPTIACYQSVTHIHTNMQFLLSATGLDVAGHRTPTCDGTSPDQLRHAEVVLQTCHFHDSSDEMQTPSHEDLLLPEALDNVHGVFDRGQGVDPVGGEIGVELQPRVAEGVLRRQCGEVVWVDGVGREVCRSALGLGVTRGRREVDEDEERGRRG
jgi:hypothetical protein